jgi:hypothetical protein
MAMAKAWECPANEGVKQQMKQSNKKLATILFLIAIASSLGTLSTAYSATITTQEKAEKAFSFISNVLLLDMTKYTSTMAQYEKTPPFAEGEPTIEIVDYTLEAKGSKLIASCSFSDNIFTGCLLIVQSGSILSSKHANNLIDSARDFLEKYQIYTGDDLTEMINTLSNADTTKNMTATAGNTKLKILRHTVADPETVDVILRWTYTVNGADYTAVGVTFRNGNFYALRDDRDLFKIGSTDVKITKEQATSLAIKYVQNYSYTGITGSDENPKYVEISGFSIAEENITVELNTYPRESLTLYPYWSVQLPLTENYPGNVWALRVSVWADSGETFLCQPLAVGGILENPESSLSQEANSSTSELPINVAILLTAIISALAIATVILKKRRT